MVNNAAIPVDKMGMTHVPRKVTETLMSKRDLVWSSDGGDQRKSADTKAATPNKGPTKMRLESGGRGGKQVTVLFNLPFAEDEARDIMRTLQGRLGTGGTFKNGTIEFRGDVRAKVEEYFATQGLKIIRAGG